MYFLLKGFIKIDGSLSNENLVHILEYVLSNDLMD